MDEDDDPFASFGESSGESHADQRTLIFVGLYESTFIVGLCEAAPSCVVLGQFRTIEQAAFFARAAALERDSRAEPTVLPMGFEGKTDIYGRADLLSSHAWLIHHPK